MASSFLTVLVPAASLLIIACLAPPAEAVATPPAPAANLNLTGILDKAGQYQTLIRLLNSTQTIDRLKQQLNDSNSRLTVLAPNDNAFNNLPSNYFHDLNAQQQVALLLYHVIPQYITQNQLSFVSNPVSTESTGQLNGNFTLKFSGSNSEHNVSSGLTSSRIGTPLYDKSPLAVYPIDAVLMPIEFNQTAAPVPSSSPSPSSGSSSKGKGTASGSNATVPSAPASGSAAGKLVTAGFATWLVIVFITILF